MPEQPVPVVTIDGPSGAGKGTVALQVAEHLGWHLLDSGALYRLTGIAVAKAGGDFTDAQQAAEIASNLKVRFSDGKVFLQEEEVSLAIRTETVGNYASKVAAIPAVRAALLDWQRRCAQAPGLVADGRDMGTTVFPHALLKVFLTASADERAQRRYKQLNEKGIAVNVAHLAAEILARDERDRQRSHSPLLAADDALHIDSTQMTIEAVVTTVLQAVHKVLPV